MPACPSRVSASCLTSLLVFVLARACELRLACELLTHFDCRCTNRSRLSVSIRAVGFVVLLVGFALQPPARVFLSLRPGGCYMGKHTTTELGVCDYGLCICGEPSAIFQSCSGLRERCVHVRESLPYHARMSFSLRLDICMEDDEGAGVEWMETRRQEELARAQDVVVHSGYVPVRTLLATCGRDLYWPISRRQFAWCNQVSGSWSPGRMSKPRPLRERSWRVRWRWVGWRRGPGEWEARAGWVKRP